MPVFVVKQVIDYADDPEAGPLVSFTFETFAGLGPALWVEEHRGVVAPARATSLLWQLHRKNLCLSWLGGFPGMFPVISYLCYRSQLGRVRRQVAAGTPTPFPRAETASEKRRVAVRFIGLMVLCVVVLATWRGVHPASFDRLVAWVKRL